MPGQIKQGRGPDSARRPCVCHLCLRGTRFRRCPKEKAARQSGSSGRRPLGRAVSYKPGGRGAAEGGRWAKAGKHGAGSWRCPGPACHLSPPCPSCDLCPLIPAEGFQHPHGSPKSKLLQPSEPVVSGPPFWVPTPPPPTPKPWGLLPSERACWVAGTLVANCFPDGHRGSSPW